ncbi:dynamin family protein [Nitrosomonas ureae]|uniref:Dynamin family protein n=1 Tax=Nitrosomonas ureae TaxID=44577 RepID=A0A2T5IK39_9PROT|nr:dynamin family protein [Nitrosomonas ureae]PTQ84210.1 dynamin family protein [Nitrosomonas ureae]PXX14669.1 dynamin family protein [Nitrosomonas ureae]
MSHNSTQINKYLKSLQKHLVDEHPDNPTLANAVKSFRKMDYVGHSMGLINKDESYATCVTWWPMIAVLGTFSAGKSTYINSYLDMPLQRTGNQAVDDKFTVICFSRHNEAKTLPGIALDADPRFPFFQISRSIDEISEAGQERIDAYLQLKTCPSENIRGKIMIDSPGFDADNQRASTLRLTQHIINLSDLVLVFFDARHPEPKAMQDTLAYLVSASVNRADANKFLYILNQIDVTAQEDNPEEVVSAWQRSLAEVGLISGRFYRIYNPSAAVPIANPHVRERFEKKREEDMADINARMHQIEVERSYRIVGKLEQTAKDIKNKKVNKLSEMLKKWKNKVIFIDGLVFFTLAVLAGTAFTMTESWDLLKTFATQLMQGETSSVVIAVFALISIIYVHFSIRRTVANGLLRKLDRELGNDHETFKQYLHAFNKSTAAYRPMLLKDPVGWNETTQQMIDEIINEANDYIQALNDQFTNPSGNGGKNSQV